MDGQPVADPLAHLALTSLIAIWNTLSETQQQVCASYRGVGVDDLDAMCKVAHGNQDGDRGRKMRTG